MIVQFAASHPHWKIIGGLFFAAVLAGCSSVPKSISPEPDAKPAASSRLPKDVPVLPPAGSGRGGYYLDDGPGDQIPEGLLDTPDAMPKIEAYSRGAANRPYVALGQTYTPITDNRPYKKRGYGSWYGKKFHGKRTSSGEPYDMYKMTAAHPTLPIPCYVRVTNLNNGRQIIVRVNDRGPFRSGRIIDLSYTAALKLGYLGKGSGQLEVEHLLPDEIDRLAQSRRDNSHAGQAVVAVSNRENREDEEQKKRDILDDLIAANKDAPASAGTSAQGGYYIQLGAYKQAENAQLKKAQYELKWRGKLPAMEVTSVEGAYHRLYAGPFRTREEAAEAARRLHDTGGARPLIVQR